MTLHDRQITTTISDPVLRLRAESAEWLVLALEACDPQEAVPICSAYLETAETGGPRMQPFGELQARDARLWADAAPPHELVAYTLAGLDRLPKAHLSLPARKRLFKHLWKGFSPAERAAFLAHVDGRPA